MRLINIHTLELEEFFEREIPSYYIFSHRWVADEISYKDYIKKRKVQGLGYMKIIGACKIARQLASRHETSHRNDSMEESSWPFDIHFSTPPSHIWIDTCCIDKRSTAELSKAINSMYMWYGKATLCIAYLSDVRSEMTPGLNRGKASFEKSTWFSRGWTLQELLAPGHVVFCNAAWHMVGFLCSRSEPHACINAGALQSGPNLLSTIARATNIPATILSDADSIFESSEGYLRPSVAQIMSWASSRSTTRIED